MRKLLFVDLLLTVFVLVFSIFVVENNKSTKITKYIQQHSSDVEKDLPDGFYLLEENSKTYSLSSSSASYTIPGSININLERTSILLNGYEGVGLNEGDIVKKGSVIAKKTSAPDLTIDKEARFLYSNNEEMVFECLANDSFVLEYRLDYDVIFFENEFYVEIGDERIDLYLESYEFLDERMLYKFYLGGLFMNENMINGQVLDIYMKALLDNALIVKKGLVFLDDNGYYVKKVRNTALFGKIYEKKYIDVANETFSTYIVKGLEINDILAS